MKYKIAVLMKHFSMVLGAVAVSVCSAAGNSTEPASADAERGRFLAVERCSACHLVSPDQSVGTTVFYPGFANLANRPDADYHWIASALRMSRRHMPDPALSEAEINYLAAYIIGLGSR